MGYLIRVENPRNGKIRYVAVAHGGGVNGTDNREHATIYESRKIADHVALDVLKIIRPFGFVEIQEVQ